MCSAIKRLKFYPSFLMAVEVYNFGKDICFCHIRSGFLFLSKTDPECNKLPVYKERLLSLDRHLKSELGMEYGALFVVRYTATESTNNNKASKEYSKMVSVRAAQFELAEEHDDIYIATDLCEQIPNLMTDHGFHYSQEGYNLIGKSAA